jgi:hypothetical protein
MQFIERLLTHTTEVVLTSGGLKKRIYLIGEKYGEEGGDESRRLPDLICHFQTASTVKIRFVLPSDSADKAAKSVTTWAGSLKAGQPAVTQSGSSGNFEVSVSVSPS